MSGKPKEVVNYFPHMCNASDGRTLYILEHKYGNGGYTFWFKLLEILGATAGHFFDFTDPQDWQYLVARTRAPDTKTAEDILKTLADTNAIDRELYMAGVIWSDNFVEGLSQVYQKRVAVMPDKPSAALIMSGDREHKSDTRHDISDTRRLTADPFAHIPDTSPVSDMHNELKEVTEVTKGSRQHGISDDGKETPLDEKYRYRSDGRQPLTQADIDNNPSGKWRCVGFTDKVTWDFVCDVKDLKGKCGDPIVGCVCAEPAGVET